MIDFIIWMVPFWVMGSFVGAWMIGKGIKMRMREMDD